MKLFLLACLGVGALAGAELCASAGQPSAISKPNIIMILSDDVGLGDIGCTGGAFKTPQIDSLAKSGTRFEFCYATPFADLLAVSC
jgi:hypothetical protein